MTKSEIKSEISDCQTSIDAENVRITALEEKIKYYEAINSKLEKGEKNLSGFCSSHKKKIKKEKTTYSKVKFINTYISDMVDYFEGQDYKNTQNDFENAKKTIAQKKSNAVNEISNLKSTIATQQTSISDLKADYDAIVWKEKQEAEEAEKAEKEKKAKSKKKYAKIF